MSGANAPVRTEARDGVLVITIDRPQVRNAIDEATANGIGAALDRLDEDASLSVGILTGAGSTFCAGMDLRAFLAGERPAVPGRGFAGIVERPPASPLIAAVEGWALAGGFEIVLACDLIVCGAGARFGLPEVKRGLIPAGGGLLRLPARIPYHRAMEAILTGDAIDADEARSLGLVSQVVDDGGALAAARALASRIAANGPLALRAAKRVVAESPGWAGEEAFRRQAEIYEPVRGSDDAREGALAFTEKRPPRWRGR